MKKFSGAFLIFGIYYFLKMNRIQEDANFENILLMGTMFIGAYLLALALKKIKLPKLTGFMITGFLLGPNVLHFLSHENLEGLKFFENFALAFIAITAGGELKFSRIKNVLKPVLFILFNQIFLVYFLLLIMLIPLSQVFLKGFLTNQNYLIGFAILFAAAALSKSPATTMGIISELKAKGRLTDIVLSVTVLKSIFVVLVFPFIITYAKIFLIEHFTFDFGQVISLGKQVLGSLTLGVVFGIIIILFLKYVRMESMIFLFLTGVLITEVSHIFDLEILITSIVTGIVVENFSEKGEELIEGIKKTSLPLYIVFFTFAGASLHVDTLRKALAMTLLLVVLRMILLYFSNFLAGYVLKENKVVKHYSWLGFIGQAGIAVGLANIIENAIPGEIGMIFKSILIATVVINEFLGPIFFKFLLVKAGEAQAE